MQGSLIFVVIVAVWAAYLVQHWVRRREEAAEVRSVAGFSQAMRVLKKRPLLPSTELAAPRPHSYMLTPARSGRFGRSGFGVGATRSTVEVKRAVPVGAARPMSALTARSTVTTQRSDLERTSMTASPTRTDPAEVEPMPNTLAPQRPSRSGSRDPASRRLSGEAPADRNGSAASGAGPNGSRGSAGSSLAQRRLRAALLLVALLWVPVSIVLAAMSLLTWFSVPFALLTVAAVLFWLRTEAAADRAARGGRVHGSGGSVASLDRAPVLSVDDTQAVATHAYAASEQDDADGTYDAEVAATERAQPAARQAAAFFDGQASETATAAEGAAVAASAAIAAQEAVPGTWSPVPVPRPTYSMKAKATPRMTESGIPADVFATPEFADEADELDERGLFARRAVSG